jgi:hypothetical protein
LDLIECVCPWLAFVYLTFHKHAFRQRDTEQSQIKTFLDLFSQPLLQPLLQLQRRIENTYCDGYSSVERSYGDDEGVSKGSLLECTPNLYTALFLQGLSRINLCIPLGYALVISSTFYRKEASH